MKKVVNWKTLSVALVLSQRFYYKQYPSSISFFTLTAFVVAKVRLFSNTATFWMIKLQINLTKDGFCSAVRNIWRTLLTFQPFSND